jgi:hypothetical protein
MNSPDPTSATALPRRRNPNWIWVFVALAVLGILAVAINWAYNVGEPLTPEKLSAARELWKRNGPADYDLKIIISSTNSSGQTTSNTIDVKVRGGQVVSFLIDGREPPPLIGPDEKRRVDDERRQREGYTVDGIFDAVQEFMERDKRENIHSYVRARFDKTDGHVILFSRQVGGKRQPLLQVKLERS